MTKDVPPYTIVGGIPAKEIRKRFAPEAIVRLQALKWWDWPIDKIRTNLPALTQGDWERLR